MRTRQKWAGRGHQTAYGDQARAGKAMHAAGRDHHARPGKRRPCTKLNLGIFSSPVTAHIVEAVSLFIHCNSLGLGQTIIMPIPNLPFSP
jgi:hypothetical protein